MRRRSLIAVAACTAILLPGVPGAVTVPSPGCIPRPTPPDVGIEEVSRTALDERLLDLRVHSAAMGGEQPVYVLLPAGYDPSGATRYPVLYLLHGALDDYTSWPRNGVADVIGDRPMIVVMPDDGEMGSYSDWYGTLAGLPGPVPSFETYHVEELVPFIDASFPTVADASGRFIAGLSSGGAGAVKYAAAHPGLFGAAGEFSGAVHTTIDYPFYPVISEALWTVSLIPGYEPSGGFCTWGDPFTQRVVWEDNNATYLAENLRGIPLFLACGDGSAGPYDEGPTWDPVEYEVWAMNQQFAATLDALGIPHTDEFYGPGTHTWPYWLRDLEHFLVWLEPHIGAPVAAPTAWSFRSARTSFSAWGWDFTVERDAREFVYLSGVSASGFTVVGSGMLGVLTAPLFAPGGGYTVAIDGAHPVPTVADAAGRLHIAVDLGPSHLLQQHDFAPDAAADWTHATVEIAPL